MKVAKIAGFCKSLRVDKELATKTNRIMRITAFLLLAACLEVHARGNAQGNFTLSVKDAPLETVFKAIERQSHYHFFYDYPLLRQTKNVSLDVKQASLEHVLAICFQGQPLTYSVVGQLIVVKQAAEISAAMPAPGRPEMFGEVRAEDGTPLGGATVEIDELHFKGITDEKGQFRVKDVPDGNYRLRVSYIGYDRYQGQISIQGGQGRLAITLKRANNNLDEVHIIAYGQTTQRLSTGDVSLVKGVDIAKQPVDNPLLAMEGRVPGLFISQNSGVSGGGITTRVEGQNSLGRGNDPLYVIDGIPYISQLLPNISGTFGILGGNGNTNSTYAPGGGGNPLAFINPQDIESISILKDADATAIYGSRAANGAILITTKKGKAGGTRVDLNLQQGWGKVTRLLPLLNTPQYLAMRHEAFANDGLTPGATDYDINGTWDTTRSTNWQKALLGGTAHYTDAELSASGGTVNTQFLASGGYHGQTTVFPGNLGDQKGSLHLNMNHTSLNRRFHLQVDGKYLVDKNRLISTDLTNTAINLAPDAPALYNADGSLNWAPLASGSSTWVNPLAYLNGKYTVRTNNLISNAAVDYELVPGLKLMANLGYTNLQSNEVSVTPLDYWAPQLRTTTARSSSFENSNVTSWIVEPQITYKHTLGGGVLDLLVGSTFNSTSSSLQAFSATGFNSDAVMEDIRSAASVSVTNSLASTYRYDAFFGRINYNWSDKYIVNLTGRRDGSSRFGSANQFHDFLSAGGAWLFSNESFVKQTLRFLSFGKIRASYGTTGNDQIGDYQFMSLYTPVTAATPYQGATGLAPNALPNPYLQWEETRKLSVGLDLGLFKDRVLVSGNYYFNRSSNQLQGYLLPLITGFGNIQMNFPATVQNTGWEWVVTSKNFAGKTFSWTTSLNFTVPSVKLIRFPGLATSTYANLYVISQPIPTSRGFVNAGVDPATGLYTFVSSKGGFTSTPASPQDAMLVNNANPRLYGGLDNHFQYKGFELDVLFQFVKKNGVSYGIGNRPGRYTWNVYGTVVGNQPTWVLNRWQAPGDEKTIQKFSTNYSGTQTTAINSANISNLTFTDASFIRLRNLSFSWNVPAGWQQKMHVRNLRVYAQAENLLTFTGYKGLDPETTSTTALPPLRMMTIGLQLGL